MVEIKIKKVDKNISIDTDSIFEVRCQIENIGNPPEKSPKLLP